MKIIEQFVKKADHVLQQFSSGEMNEHVGDDVLELLDIHVVEGDENTRNKCLVQCLKKFVRQHADLAKSFHVMGNSPSLKAISKYSTSKEDFSIHPIISNVQVKSDKVVAGLVQSSSTSNDIEQSSASNEMEQSSTSIEIEQSSTSNDDYKFIGLAGECKVTKMTGEGQLIANMIKVAGDVVLDALAEGVPIEIAVIYGILLIYENENATVLLKMTLDFVNKTTTVIKFKELHYKTAFNEVFMQLLHFHD